MTIVVVIVHKY